MAKPLAKGAIHNGGHERRHVTTGEATSRIMLELTNECFDEVIRQTTSISEQMIIHMGQLEFVLEV